MNSQLKELYKQTLLQHSKQPRNIGPMEEPSASATVRNPLCGDEVTVFISHAKDAVSKIQFTGQCCAICTASASIMTEQLAGKPTEEAAAFAESFIANLKAKNDAIDYPGDLASLLGVLEFPSRIRCATLPFEALQKAVASAPSQ